jgi:hypothetical protein
MRVLKKVLQEMQIYATTVLDITKYTGTDGKFIQAVATQKKLMTLDPKVLCTDCYFEYCSMLYLHRSVNVDSIYTYDLLKLARKILTKNLNKDTFEDYKTSVFDKLKPALNNREAANIVHFMAHKLPISLTTDLIDQLQAFCTTEWEAVEKQLNKLRIELGFNEDFD